MGFIAIDVEPANPTMASICATNQGTTQKPGTLIAKGQQLPVLDGPDFLRLAEQEANCQVEAKASTGQGPPHGGRPAEPAHGPGSSRTREDAVEHDLDKLDEVILALLHLNS